MRIMESPDNRSSFQQLHHDRVASPESRESSRRRTRDQHPFVFNSNSGKTLDPGSQYASPDRKPYVLMQSPSKRFLEAAKQGTGLPPSAAERQLQERFAYLNKVMRMDKHERRNELLELSRRSLNKKPEDPEERARVNEFLNRLERELEFPTAAIEKELLKKRDGIKRLEANPALRQKLLRDDLVAGLCLLSGVSVEQIRQSPKSSPLEPSDQLERLAKAMVTLHSFASNKG